jgi:NAD+ synthase (glutamine-hydrolysing)
VITWEHIDRLKEEEFSRAVSLGLFDYLRKSQSKGFVVSLSGGADSSAVTCLVAIMVGLAVKQLGIDGFKNRLGYIQDLTAKDTRGLIKQLLTCVYQSTRNSSETTKTSAAGLAFAIGAEFLEFDVDPLVENYQEIVATSLGRKLTWESDDISLQNIQARVRSPGVWLVANLKQSLLLSTSNRSEAAVGYATMDGDTSGGLSPIAGIDKAFLCRWLLWVEKKGPTGLKSFSALGPVNNQEPSAELRPKEHRQTDEADLMPYPLLDAIERAAIRDKKDPLEIFSLVELRFPEYEPKQLARWIKRFFVLWSRNQWKRERYAPSFHLDDENLDPKTWCRFPILSGGFKRELKELDKFIND